MSRSNLNHFTIKNWWLVYFFLSLKIMKVCTNTPQVMTKIVTNCDKLSFFFCFHQQTWLIISNIKYHFYSQTASVDVIHNNPVILPVWLLAVIIWDNAHTHHHNNRHQHLLSSMFSDGEIQSRKKKNSEVSSVGSFIFLENQNTSNKFGPEEIGWGGKKWK